ncbi:MAG: GspH/FimT family pseudopilin [Pseudomonas sp.]|nr:GspH/FimT family pseudopilin [Pseudomonas sp.]
MNSSTGFSLIELIVVVAIIAIIATIGVPSYQSMMERGRVTSASNNLLGAMQLARSEAATRRTSVTVCASSDQSTCAGNDWSAGGLVVTSGGEVIRIIPATSDVAITGAAITFRSDGTPAASGSITVDSTNNVSVNAIGHAKIE